MVTPQSQNVHKLPQKRISQCHKTVGRWFIFICFAIRIQPTWLCFMMEFVVGTISLLCDHFLKLLLFMWGRHYCVLKMVFRFTCAVLWKLHG